MKVSWGFSCVKESVANGGTGNGTVSSSPLPRCVRFSHRRARVSFHLTFRKERDRWIERSALLSRASNYRQIPFLVSPLHDPELSGTEDGETGGGRGSSPSFYFLFQAPPTGSISTHSSLKFADKALCRSIKSARIRKKGERKKEREKRKCCPPHRVTTSLLQPSKTPSRRLSFSWNNNRANANGWKQRGRRKLFLPKFLFSFFARDRVFWEFT